MTGNCQASQGLGRLCLCAVLPPGPAWQQATPAAAVAAYAAVAVAPHLAGSHLHRWVWLRWHGRLRGEGAGQAPRTAAQHVERLQDETSG
jgi:hypothetical protein